MAQNILSEIMASSNSQSRSSRNSGSELSIEASYSRVLVDWKGWALGGLREWTAVEHSRGLPSLCLTLLTPSYPESEEGISSAQKLKGMVAWWG